MILGQEIGVLVAETFNHLIALDTPFIASMFVARKRTGLLLYHLQQMMFLEKWKTLSPLDIFLPSFNFGIWFRLDGTFPIA